MFVCDCACLCFVCVCVLSASFFVCVCLVIIALCVLCASCVRVLSVCVSVCLVLNMCVLLGTNDLIFEIWSSYRIDIDRNFSGFPHAEFQRSLENDRNARSSKKKTPPLQICL